MDTSPVVTLVLGVIALAVAIAVTIRLIRRRKKEDK